MNAKSWQPWPEDCEYCGSHVEIYADSDETVEVSPWDTLKCTSCSYSGEIVWENDRVRAMWHWELVDGLQPECTCQYCQSQGW